MEIQIKTINYRLPYLKRLFNKFDGNTSIVGMMLESNLHEGNQPIPSKLEQLKYGVSVTDKCIGWEETEKIILAAHEKLN